MAEEAAAVAAAVKAAVDAKKKKKPAAKPEKPGKAKKDGKPKVTDEMIRKKLETDRLKERAKLANLYRADTI